MGNPRIIVFGASSYIGRSLCEYLEKNNFEITQSSRANCDFLNAESVKNFFGSLPELRYSIVFLSTINQNEANSILGFEKNINIMRNFIENIERGNHGIAHSFAYGRKKHATTKSVQCIFLSSCSASHLVLA